MQTAKMVMSSILNPLSEDLLALEHLGEETTLNMLSRVTYESVVVLPEQSSFSSSHSPSVLFLLAQTGSAVAIILALTALVRALAALIQAAQG